MRGSDYNTHDKQGYKFFTFSNIFPINDIQKNDIRNLIVASPNDTLISYIKEQLDYIRNIRIGQMKFRIDRTDKLNIVPKCPFTLITATPIVAKIHKYRYEQIGAQDLVNGYDAIYWRSNHPVQLFIEQLEDNLVKKYNQYHGLENKKEDKETLFYRFRFLRQVCRRLTFSKRPTIPQIGTLWEFDIFENTKLIQFGIDTGFGQMNSLGFGFMNVKRHCNN